MIRDLSILLHANIPLVTALAILADSAKPKDKVRLNAIKQQVESGMPLSKACANYPKNYSAMICKLLEAGERAAALPVILNNIADYQEKMADFKARLIKALFYPSVILFVSLLVSIAMLLFVVPEFENLFSSMGVNLPDLTQVVLLLSRSIKNYYWIILVGVFTVTGLVYHYRQYFLRAPIISAFQNKVSVARFSRTMAILLDAGVPLVDGLYLLSEQTIRESVLRGEMLSNAIQSPGCFLYFTPLMIQMIKVGEASGALSQMLLRIALITEHKIEQGLQRFTQLLEPCVMIFMGIFIGGLVVAMYLPVFQLGRVV